MTLPKSVGCLSSCQLINHIVGVKKYIILTSVFVTDGVATHISNQVPKTDQSGGVRLAVSGHRLPTRRAHLSAETVFVCSQSP